MDSPANILCDTGGSGYKAEGQGPAEEQIGIRFSEAPNLREKLSRLISEDLSALAAFKTFLIGSYRISPPKQNLSYVKLPYSPVLGASESVTMA